MTMRPVPTRHWRSYGTAPLPTATDALQQPFAAFPSWFLRIECDHCGKARMLNEVHAPPSSGADLGGAHLKRADLSGADLDHMDLIEAHGDARTLLPEGIVLPEH